MRRYFAMAVLCAGAAYGQDLFVVTATLNLSAAGRTISVAQPATSTTAKRIEIISITAQCETASCYLEIVKDGTIGTSTALTPVFLGDAPGITAAFLAYSNATITGGTVSTPSGGWKIPTDALLPIPYSALTLERTSVSKAWSARIVSPFTGTARIQIVVRQTR
jgi:hypothetical protein